MARTHADALEVVQKVLNNHAEVGPVDLERLRFAEETVTGATQCFTLGGTVSTGGLPARVPGMAPRPRSCARRLRTPKHFGAKHQTCPHLAVHVPPDSTLEMGATEMGAAIRCSVIGDSPQRNGDG
jgi:hypothetical protein